MSHNERKNDHESVSAHAVFNENIQKAKYSHQAHDDLNVESASVPTTPK